MLLLNTRIKNLHLPRTYWITIFFQPHTSVVFIDSNSLSKLMVNKVLYFSHDVVVYG